MSDEVTSKGSAAVLRALADMAESGEEITPDMVQKFFDQLQAAADGEKGDVEQELFDPQKVLAMLEARHRLAPGVLMLEQQPKIRTFQEVLQAHGGVEGAIVALRDEPLVQELPVPGERAEQDAKTELANLFLEGRGLRRPPITAELTTFDMPVPGTAEPSGGIAQEFIGPMPVPTSTVENVHHRGALLQEPLPQRRPVAIRHDTRPAGEYAGIGGQRMPVPN